MEKAKHKNQASWLNKPSEDHVFERFPRFDNPIDSKDLVIALSARAGQLEKILDSWKTRAQQSDVTNSRKMECLAWLRESRRSY